MWDHHQPWCDVQDRVRHQRNVYPKKKSIGPLVHHSIRYIDRGYNESKSLNACSFQGKGKRRKSVKRWTGSDWSWTKTHGMKLLVPKLKEAIKPPFVNGWVTLFWCIGRQETEMRLGETIGSIQTVTCLLLTSAVTCISAPCTSMDALDPLDAAKIAYYFFFVSCFALAWKSIPYPFFKLLFFNRLHLSFRISAAWLWVPSCTALCIHAQEMLISSGFY